MVQRVAATADEFTRFASFARDTMIASHAKDLGSYGVPARGVACITKNYRGPCRHGP